MVATTVANKAVIGKGTALQMNYGTPEVPDWKTIPGLMSAGEVGYDQDFLDETPLADEYTSSTAGEAKSKERLITCKDVPGDADFEVFLSKSLANEIVQLKDIHATGRTFVGNYLLSQPYWPEGERNASMKVSIKASPQGLIVPGKVA
jgi:hypothetical protein